MPILKGRHVLYTFPLEYDIVIEVHYKERERERDIIQCAAPKNIAEERFFFQFCSFA